MHVPLPFCAMHVSHLDDADAPSNHDTVLTGG